MSRCGGTRRPNLRSINDLPDNLQSSVKLFADDDLLNGVEISTCKKYTFYGDELEEVEDINYLEITLTSKLKWDEHVSTVLSKASVPEYDFSSNVSGTIPS